MVAADLEALKDVDLAHLLHSQHTHVRNRRHICNPAEPAPLKLGELLQDGNVQAVEVVQHKLTDHRAGEDVLHTRCGDLLEDLVMRLSVRSTGY